MSQEWYYSQNGDRQGPISAPELKKLATEGKLKETDLVWTDSMKDWAPAKSVKALFTAPASGSTPVAKADAVSDDADDRPPARSRRRDDDEDEENDRPRRRRLRDEDEDDDRPRSRTRDEDDDDRPRKRKRREVPEDVKNKKMVAGLLGILLNAWGIHKFYLGMNGAGLTMLLVSLLTCGIGALVMWPIGLIEGIIYLTKSDEDFYQTYIIEKKAWF